MLFRSVRAPLPLEEARTRASIRRELDTPEDSVVLLQASRLERWKGQGLLVEALGRLRTRAAWTVWMVGGAQRDQEKVYLAELQALGEKLGIAPQIRWLGQRSDVSALMAAADIFCQPNLAPEPFGIVFIEALGRGLPVVTTSMGAALEILDSDCGVLVSPDGDSLARALTNLIESADARVRLGARGPERALLISGVERQLSHLGSVLSAVARGNAGVANAG